MRNLFLAAGAACLVFGASAHNLTELAERQKAFDETLRRKKSELLDAQSLGDKTTEAKLAAFCKSVQDQRDLNTLEIAKVIIRKRKESGEDIEAGAAINALNTLDDSISALKEAVRVAQEEKLGPATVNEARVALATAEASRASIQKDALWEAIYLDCFAMMEQRFPDTKNPQSEFSKRLEAELEKLAEASLDDPRHLLNLAIKVDDLLSAERLKAKFKDVKLLPPEEIRRNLENREKE